MTTPTRVAGIIIDKNKILLIRRKKLDSEYWVLPGGGLEKDDLSPENGLLREITEETTLKVEVVRCIYVHDYSTSKGLYYQCRFISGTPKLDDSIEKKRMEENKNDWYKPVWIDLSVLPKTLLYPLEIRDWVVEDLKNGFPSTPRELKIDTKELRKA